MRSSTTATKDPRILDRQLISFLIENKKHVSGEFLSRKLGISRTAIWKKINNLKKAGFKIKSANNLGYLLTDLPNTLTAEVIEYHCKNKITTSKISTFKTIDSTNRVVKEWGQRGEPHGRIAFAESQTEGRGRMGRQWQSPPEKGLYFSMLIRPKMNLADLPKITLASAVAISKAIQKNIGLSVGIKWPNDLMIGGKKCCGILTEISADSDTIHYAVIGIGLNVNNSQLELPEGATSLSITTNKEHNRASLAASIIDSILEYYQKLKSGQWIDIEEEWNQRSMINGQQVLISGPGQELIGKAIGIDHNGALRFKPKGKEELKITSGDVSLRRQSEAFAKAKRVQP